MSHLLRPFSHPWLFNYVVFVTLASLDNAAAGVVPPLYALIAKELAVRESLLGGVTSLFLLIVAIAAVLGGYRADQRQRKPLLLGGTLIWGSGMIGTALAPQFWGFLAGQLVTAVGVGAVSAVGFSIVADLVPAQRRGAALSLWSMSQGIGAAVGALLGSSIGAFNWRWPFVIIALLGFLFAALYGFANEPERGQAEPELAPLFAAGGHYRARISLHDLANIWRQSSNRWLLAQSFFFALAYGVTLWVPRWAIARVQAEGYTLQTATIVGNLFVALFSLGAFLSILFGHWGDRLQRRTPRGRPLLATFGLLGSIPFFVALYFIPLQGVNLPTNSNNLIEIGWAVLRSLFQSPWVMAAFAVAFLGLALQAADPPNWAAMITDLNLPEHRGTVIGASRLARAVGNAISVAAGGVLFEALAGRFAPPLNLAVGLSLFQLLVIPAALCYVVVSRVIGQDRRRVQETLRARAAQANAPLSD